MPIYRFPSVCKSDISRKANFDLPDVNPFSHCWGGIKVKSLHTQIHLTPAVILLSHPWRTSSAREYEIDQTERVKERRFSRQASTTVHADIIGCMLFTQDARHMRLDVLQMSLLQLAMQYSAAGSFYSRLKNGSIKEQSLMGRHSVRNSR